MENRKYEIEDVNYVNDMVVSWVITHKCQESCGYCISPNVKNEIQKIEDHLIIQDKLISGGVTKIRYIGGEPLIINHIFELIKNARLSNVNTRLSTNGLLLNENHYKYIRKYLNSLAFPFESLDSKLNKSIRGTENHDKIIQEKIKIIKSFENIGILINTCVHKENIYKLDELGHLLNELEIDHWKLRQFYSSSGRGAVPNKKRFEIDNSQFNDIVEYLKQKYTNIQIDGRISKKVESRLIVSPQGDLTKMTSDGREYIEYGNLLKDNIDVKDIYVRERCK